MKLGSLYFDIDKDKILKPEEICEYICTYPEGELFLTNLLMNNSKGFCFIEVPGDIKKDEKGYRIILSEEFLKEVDFDNLNSSDELFIPLDSMPKSCFQYKNRENLHFYILLYNCFEDSSDEDNVESSMVVLYDYKDNSVIKQLAEDFFERNNIDTMKKVRDEMKRARDIYKNETGDDSDIFDFSELKENIDNQFFLDFLKKKDYN